MEFWSACCWSIEAAIDWSVVFENFETMLAVLWWRVDAETVDPISSGLPSNSVGDDEAEVRWFKSSWWRRETAGDISYSYYISAFCCRYYLYQLSYLTCALVVCWTVLIMFSNFSSMRNNWKSSLCKVLKRVNSWNILSQFFIMIKWLLLDCEDWIKDWLGLRMTQRVRSKQLESQHYIELCPNWQSFAA